MPVFGTVNTQTDLTGSGTLIINGTRPPTDTDGVVGDYWLDTAGKVLYGPKGAGGYGPDQFPISVAPTSAQTGVASVSYGLRFRTLAAGRIPALRYYRYGGAAAHTVTMVLYLQSSQAELARVVISNATSAPAGWTTGSLATPVEATAGTDYRVAFTRSANGTISNSPGVPTSAIPSLVSITGHCYATSANVYPATIDDTTCFFADVVFQAASSWPIAIKSAP